MADELVAMALIGDEWALTSPIQWQLSTFHNFRNPPRHPLNTILVSGIKLNPHIQSLWAWFIDCKIKHKNPNLKQNII